MTLTAEQRIEMKTEMRELRRRGHPETATKIADALGADRYLIQEPIPGAVELPDRPPTHGSGSSTAAWREYAAAASDFDQEIIDSTSRKDLILMLEAHDL